MMAILFTSRSDQLRGQKWLCRARVGLIDFRGVLVKPLSSKCVTYFDFIRFFLAQIVVIGHGFGFFFGYWDGFFPLKAPYIQSIAVVGFFFVSGFLICRSVLANIEYKGGDYLRYYVDRFARIYTTLVPCLVFVLVVDYFGFLAFPNAGLRENLNANAFLNSLSLVPSMPFGTMRPVWSLMFEWWIYILFGGIVFFRKNWILSSVCIGFGGYYTFYVNAQGEAGHLEIIWFVGAFSAFLFERISRVVGAKYLASVVLLASVAAYLKTLNAYNVFAGVLLSIGLLLLAVGYNSDREMLRPRLSYAFSALAGYSFTLFLTHYTVLFWLQKIGFSGLSGLCISLVLSNAIAYAIAYVTESHHKEISSKLLGFINLWRSKLV